ncbi:MAG TPA: DUF4129 domain-containing protein, partial [Kribbellaceae bacterium]|nr:DUF4129 domain-containing protein [Kribbellaceae bacterium]
MREGRGWGDGSRRGVLAATGAVALSAVTLALVVLASSAGSVHPVAESTATAKPRQVSIPTQNATPTPSGSPTAPFLPPGKPWDMPGWLITTIQLVLLGVLVTGIVLLVRVIVRAIVSVAREIELPEGESTDASHWQKVARAEVSDAVAEGGDAMLASGTPASAIVACWLALERAAASAGVNRRPSETPAEFTLRVLGSADVPAAPLERLA